MTKKELIEKLNEAAEAGDPEVNHSWADELLIQYINDPEIEKAYNRVEKWYA